MKKTAVTSPSSSSAAKDGKSTTKDNNDTTRKLNTKTLALVLKKLNDSGHARKDDEFYTLNAKEAAEYEEKNKDGSLTLPVFDQAAADAIIAAVFDKKENSKEALLEELNALYEEKRNSTKTLLERLDPTIASCRTVYKLRDDTVMEKLRLEEEIEKLEKECAEKADLCRTLQQKTKEMQNLQQKILEEEIKKTEDMKTSFTDSINGTYLSLTMLLLSFILPTYPYSHSNHNLSYQVFSAMLMPKKLH